MAFGAAFAAVALGPGASTLGMDPPLWGVLAGTYVGAVAGLLPDIDEPNAMLARGSWLPRRLGPLHFGWLSKFVGMILALPFKLVGIIIKGLLGHRGGTHSFAMSIVFTLIAALAITIPMGSSGDFLIWAIWLGFMSHLIADSLNPSGVPWFWPLLSKNVKYRIIPRFLTIPTTNPPQKSELMLRFGMRAITAVIVLWWGVLLPVGVLFG